MGTSDNSRDPNLRLEISYLVGLFHLCLVHSNKVEYEVHPALVIIVFGGRRGTSAVETDVSKVACLALGVIGLIGV